MDAAGPQFERLQDGLVLLVISRLPEWDDRGSLAQTCQRLCRMVRISRRFKLRLNLRDAQQLQQVPASRAWEEVHHLGVDLDRACLQQEGCWDALGRVLLERVQRWPGIETVHVAGDAGTGLKRQPLAALAAPLAGLKGAANLRKLILSTLAHTSDLPHLGQLSQVTDLNVSPYPGSTTPLVLDNPPSGPLAALKNLMKLELPQGWCITGNAADDTFNDYNCPLALPPCLTALTAVWVECSPGSLWRHIAACSELQALELFESGVAARSHPSWALHELAGSLGRLKKLVIQHEGMGCAKHPKRRLRQLLRLLYLPEEEDVAPAVLEAALALAVRPVPVAGFEDEGAAHHMMLPPPDMEGFSSLETLQLPGGIYDGWWLMASAPHHWAALAGCSSLRQLEGLHASQQPPADVQFPGVTQLDVTVAPSDALRVLVAFPALRELKITSVVTGDQQQEEPAALPQQPAEQQQLIAQQPQAAAAASRPQAAQPPVFAGVTRLALDLDPLAHGPLSDSRSKNMDGTAAAAYCSTLWRAVPGLTDLEVDLPSGMALPSLAPLQGLTSLRVHMPSWWQASPKELAPLVDAMLGMLSGAPALQQLGLTMLVVKRDMDREALAQQVRAVLPGLQNLQLEFTSGLVPFTCRSPCRRTN